jgi:hypothetical protein
VGCASVRECPPSGGRNRTGVGAPGWRDNRVRRWVVVSESAGALGVVVCMLVAGTAGAAPKAFLATLVGLGLIAIPLRWARDRWFGVVTALVAVSVCVVAVTTHWAYPLSKAATAKLLESKHPADGPVRCVGQPHPGGYLEFGDPLFGRIYVCGWKKHGDWAPNGVLPGRGIGVEVSDTHVVRVWI